MQISHHLVCSNFHPDSTRPKHNIPFLDLISIGRDILLNSNPNAELYSVTATPEGSESLVPVGELTNIEFKALDNVTGNSIYVTSTSAGGFGKVSNVGKESNFGVPLDWPITMNITTAIRPIHTLSRGFFSEAVLKKLKYPSGPPSTQETVWEFTLASCWCQVGVFDDFVSCFS